jgi:4-diphosphocytidyl-2-C-methyl-D-erythritol kinase
MSSMRAHVRAKINLWLSVRSRRQDGWHNIETLFHCIDLTDKIMLSTDGARAIEVDMIMPDGQFEEPALEENLAYRAARAFAAAKNLSLECTIRIDKGIPLRAGLAGGSADAAAVLLLLAAEFGPPSSPSLHDLALGLGSDVPFFLVGGTAWATGRGEVLHQIEIPPQLNLLVAQSHDGLETAAVYERWDQLPKDDPPVRDRMSRALAGGREEEIALALHNGLEPAIFSLRPELREKKERLLGAGALGACVSGSGPTIFGIARDPAHARDVRRRVGSIFDRVDVVESAASCFEQVTPHQ